MQTIKIFLASSEELKTDREQFEIFINRQNKQLADKNIFLHLEIWEDFIDAMSQTRLQDEYNKAIENCDIFLLLFFTKVGLYTREEFEKAFGKFKETNRPLIYTYFKDNESDPGSIDREIITLFEFKERLKELGHFYSSYKNIHDLLHQCDEQLKKLKVYEGEFESFISGNRRKPIQLTNIPKHDDEFIGREEDLKKLEKELETSQKIVLMNGLGGIGKTTLAKKYVQKNFDKYDHVAWIDVKTLDTGHEQNLSIIEAFAYDEVLSKSLKLKFTNESNEVRFKFIIQALSNLKGKNLLVIDNAREDLNNRDIKDILPRPPHWNMLITSRNNFSGFKTLEIKTLSEEYAKELFQTYYTNPANEKDIQELLGEIGYHTLTIELLAKTLIYPGQKLTIKETLQKICSRQLSSPDLQRKIELTHSKEETEIYIHLIQTFNLSPLTENEQWLMKQFCFLLPVTYTIEELENFLDLENDEKKREFHDTLYTLNRRGWLQLNENNYNIHRVVQQMTDYQLQPTLRDAEQLIIKVTKLLFLDEYTNVTQLFYLIPYAEFILNKLTKEETENPLIGELQNYLGVAVRNMGNYEKAKNLLELALKNGIKNFGENHAIVAPRQSDLAYVYNNLGEYEKAKNLIEIAVKNGIKNFGEDHPMVGIHQSNLAVVYHNLGEYEKAKNMFESALKNGIKNFGEDHPRVATCQSNLASLYQDMGEYEKAKNLIEPALKNDIKNLGEYHPSVAIRQSLLAIIYENLGEYEKAKNLLEPALRNDIKNYGDEHPNVAIRQANLASVYKDLGEYEKAKEFIEKAYKSCMKFFGEDHPKTKLVIKKLKELQKFLKK